MGAVLRVFVDELYAQVQKAGIKRSKSKIKVGSLIRYNAQTLTSSLGNFERLWRYIGSALLNVLSNLSLT